MSCGNATHAPFVVQLDHLRRVAIGDVRNRVCLVGTHGVRLSFIFAEEALAFERFKRSCLIHCGLYHLGCANGCLTRKERLAGGGGVAGVGCAGGVGHVVDDLLQRQARDFLDVLRLHSAHTLPDAGCGGVQVELATEHFDAASADIRHADAEAAVLDRAGDSRLGVAF